MWVQYLASSKSTVSEKSVMPYNSNGLQGWRELLHRSVGNRWTCYGKVALRVYKLGQAPKEWERRRKFHATKATFRMTKLGEVVSCGNAMKDSTSLFHNASKDEIEHLPEDWTSTEHVDVCDSWNDEVYTCPMKTAKGQQNVMVMYILITHLTSSLHVPSGKYRQVNKQVKTRWTCYGKVALRVYKLGQAPKEWERRRKFHATKATFRMTKLGEVVSCGNAMKDSTSLFHNASKDEIEHLPEDS
ncbi:uncharacterized protein LACBIDRAFT_331550 [Laccaria bicolor S238N-H82]|uniref:Predicted protein n=1 Tax=Laccaria bicolor (strain S238N-H82 / ATCC MYA-4686) TaxID=486041 RepID=B0DPT7_LACBS|nr:uncharacterized protein LACBIDRAFT_331550 [Laccaria bicolor S238N-H82]EDR03429.1 predicted protein [Laccaria bicolor S238N-H82]|eukprot:XP_001885885.1 predicted protein [Laccaria bicolor S238N-H82]